MSFLKDVINFFSDEDTPESPEAQREAILNDSKNQRKDLFDNLFEKALDWLVKKLDGGKKTVPDVTSNASDKVEEYKKKSEETYDEYNKKPSIPINYIHEKVKSAYESITVGNRVMKYANRLDPRVFELMKRFNKDEDIVKVEHAGMKNAKKEHELKLSANKAFQIAREKAQEMGYDIMIGSSYRSYQEQATIWNNSKRDLSERGKWVGKPGGSWHQSGGTVDCFLVDSQGRNLTSKGTDVAKYRDILAQCMCAAGFVNYEVEHWHWEWGNTAWFQAMEKAGYLDEVDENSLSYSRTDEHHHA